MLSAAILRPHLRHDLDVDAISPQRARLCAAAWGAAMGGCFVALMVETQAEGLWLAKGIHVEAALMPIIALAVGAAAPRAFPELCVAAAANAYLAALLLLFTADGVRNVGAVVTLLTVPPVAGRVARRGVAEVLSVLSVAAVVVATYAQHHTQVAASELPVSVHWVTVLGAQVVLYICTAPAVVIDPSVVSPCRRPSSHFGHIAFVANTPSMTCGDSTPTHGTATQHGVRGPQPLSALHIPMEEEDERVHVVCAHGKRHSAPPPPVRREWTHTPPERQPLRALVVDAPKTLDAPKMMPSPLSRAARPPLLSDGGGAYPPSSGASEKSRSVSFAVDDGGTNEQASDAGGGSVYSSVAAVPSRGPSPRLVGAPSDTQHLSPRAAGPPRPASDEPDVSTSAPTSGHASPQSITPSATSDNLSERRGFGTVSINSVGKTRVKTQNACTKSTVRTVEKTVRWRKGDVLGQGGFGKVYMGLNLDTGMLMAVKSIEFVTSDKNLKQKLEQLALEIKIMSPLDHPHIVRYYFTERTGTCVNIFMEYVPGGSIGMILKSFGKLAEDVVVQYAYQLLLGLSHLHQQGIIHRDIKCGNVLLSVEGYVKLADFGASVIVDHGKRADGQHGTPFWMAPEVLREEEHGWEADIWSFGCTVMEMFTAVQPWAHLGLSGVEVCKYICDDTCEVTFPPELSLAGEVFLLDCMPRRVKRRYTAEDLLDHPFFLEDANELSAVRKLERLKELSELDVSESPAVSHSSSPRHNTAEDDAAKNVMDDIGVTTPPFGGFEPWVRPAFATPSAAKARRSRVSINCISPRFSPASAGRIVLTPPQANISLQAMVPSPASTATRGSGPPISSPPAPMHLTPPANPMMREIGAFLERRLSEHVMNPQSLLARHSQMSDLLRDRSESIAMGPAGASEGESPFAPEGVRAPLQSESVVDVSDLSDFEVHESIIQEPEADSKEGLEKYYLSVADRRASFFSYRPRALPMLQGAQRPATLPPLQARPVAHIGNPPVLVTPAAGESPVISITACNDDGTESPAVQLGPP